MARVYIEQKGRADVFIIWEMGEDIDFRAVPFGGNRCDDRWPSGRDSH